MSPLATAFYETDWFRAVVYIVIAVIVARVVDFVLARRDRAMARLLGRVPNRADRTRYVMIRRLVFIGIVFLGTSIALAQIPAVSTLARAMLASAAIGAGVIGIAARAPIANLVTGVMIAFSQPIRLNDYISVDGEHGTVEEISLIYTCIRGDDGRRIVIPNEALAMKAIHNFSRDSTGCMVAVDLALPLSADLEDAARAVLEVADALAPAPAGKQNRVEIAGLSESAAHLRIHAWTADPLRQRDLASDLRIASLRRLTGDGLLSAGEVDGGD
jgi:small-conductance mechanosensitive channel